MDEVLSWFEDEKSRRLELLLACQNNQPPYCGPEYQFSPETTPSGLHRTAPLSLAQLPSMLAQPTKAYDEHWSQVPPFSSLEESFILPSRAKRGRPRKPSLQHSQFHHPPKQSGRNVPSNFLAQTARWSLQLKDGPNMSSASIFQITYGNVKSSTEKEESAVLLIHSFDQIILQLI